MAQVNVCRGLYRWFRDPFTKVPDMELTAHGLLLPGRHALWEFFDDFNEFRLSAAGFAGWHLDESGSGTAAAIQDAQGGVMLIKPGGTATNNVHNVWANNTTPTEIWKPAAGKRFWMSTRLKIEDADQNLILVGAHITQDDPWNTEPHDQALFRTLAADPDALQFAIGKSNSTEVTISLGDLADDTWVRLVAWYDGADTVWAARYTDAGELFTASGLTNPGKVSVTSSTQGDLLPDTEMAPAFGVEAVDTGADDFQIDFIYIAQER